MKDIVQEINVLSRSHVHIKCEDKLNQILNSIAKGGIGKLQVLSDFDKTITKQHENGVPHLSSFAMFDSISSISTNEEYQSTVKSLMEKYYPIELDPSISVDDKVKYMEEWWALTEKAIRGLKITQQDIEDVCLISKPSLRDGTQEFFKGLNLGNVPVLVFSAGCGDIVLTILKQSGVYLSNVKVTSNFLKFNEQGIITGFRDKIIHIFNKNEYALKNTDFYNVLADRSNAMILGDSLGDANMAEGMDHCENVLKIGYLYDHVEQALPQYKETFDIVLVDDQTMEVPKAIFDYIKNYSE